MTDCGVRMMWPRIGDIIMKGSHMLHSVKQLFEDKLGVWDGEIGHVKDFYFDDQNWAVRYVVADTGSWMPGRLVLISPHGIGSLYQGGRVLIVNLTRKQIEDSPPIETHQPVSRRYEEEYYSCVCQPNLGQATGEAKTNRRFSPLQQMNQ